MTTPLPESSLRRALVAALAALVALTTLLPAASANAAPSRGAIQPGVRTYTAGAQCTANFVFTDRSGARYLGQAAHCANATDSTGTNGCIERSRPLGTEVEIEGATRPGVLVYSSWVTMRRVAERDPDACRYNDFALVRIHPADHGRVNPTMPVWGGPTGLAPYAHAGDRVYSYGNSSLRPVSTFDAKRGTARGTTEDRWAIEVTTPTSPGVPGDSGSGFLDPRGRAVGVLSTLNLTPRPGSNRLVNLAKALDYLERHTPLRPRLAHGWRPFSP